VRSQVKSGGDMEKIPRRERERAARKEEITEAAELQFTKYGFDNASMDAIAQESQFTKRTLYQYFPSKEELFITVAVRIHHRLLHYYEKEIQKEKNSYLKLRAIGFAHLKFAQENQGASILLKANFLTVDKSGPALAELFESRDKGLKIMAQLIKAGQKEKTIRSDLDPQLTALSLTYLLVGFFHLILSGQDDGTPEAIEEKKGMINHSIDLLFSGVRNNEEFRKNS
jgi:AcrR family transcriptional regulator